MARRLERHPVVAGRRLQLVETEAAPWVNASNAVQRVAVTVVGAEG
jgi:hypothetical protein